MKTNRLMRRLCTLTLCAALALTLLPTPARAAETPVTFEDVDTLLIYNPLRADQSELYARSTGTMTGQIIHVPESCDARTGSFLRDVKTGEIRDYDVPSVGAGTLMSVNPIVVKFDAEQPESELTDISPAKGAPRFRLRSAPASFTRPAVGEEQKFYDNEALTSFTCMAVSQKCAIWLKTSELDEYGDVFRSIAQNMATEFDETIVSSAHYWFGTGRFFDPDNNRLLHVLCSEQNGRDGYFRERDLYSSEDYGCTEEFAARYSINYDRTIIHAASNSVAEYQDNMPTLYGILAHEYQHLIATTDVVEHQERQYAPDGAPYSPGNVDYSAYFGYSLNRFETWLGESLSQAAMELAYPGNCADMMYYHWYNIAEPHARGRSLYHYTGNVSDYGAETLFEDFLRGKCGNDVVTKLHNYWKTDKNQTTGRAINAAVGSYAGAAASYSDAVAAALGEDALLSKIVLDLYIAQVRDAIDINHGSEWSDSRFPNTYAYCNPLLFYGAESAEIEGGGRILVKPKNDAYTVPEDAAPELIYVGFDRNGEITLPPTHAISTENDPIGYTVTWLNSDGTLLEKDEDVPYGATPSYDGATPTKDPTNEKTYTFSGWDPAPGKVTGNVTYTATYDEADRLYTITWMSEDKVVATSEHKYGETPVYSGPTLSKAEDNKNTYTWNMAKWVPNIVPVTGPATYNATFDATPKLYNVDFKYEATGAVNKTGILYHGTYEYDELPTYEGPGTYEKPTLEGNEQYVYTFTGWDRAIDKVTGDTTYTARFDSALREYTVRWLDGDGNPIETDDVPYGAIPAFDSNPESVTKTPNPDGTTYTWNGTWYPTVRPVDGEIDYSPNFDENVPITWVDGDGNILKTDTVPKGATPVYSGEDPTKSPTEDTKFAWDKDNGNNGWDKPQVPATGPATYTAQFKADTYKITFVDDDGTPMKEEWLPVGTMPTPPAEEPTKANPEPSKTYRFNDWNPMVHPVDGPETYKPTFDAKNKPSDVPLALSGSYDRATRTAAVSVVTTEPITLSNYDAALVWDKSLFTLDDITNGQEERIGNFFPNVAVGKISAASDGDNVTIEAGETLATFFLTAAYDLEPGYYSFALTVRDASDENGDALAWKGYTVDGLLDVSALSAENFDCRAPEGVTVEYESPAAGDFTVASEKPCIVLYNDGNGYQALEASAVDDGTYSFTLPEGFSGSEEIIVAVKGDFTGDGEVSSTDALQVLRCAAGNREFDEASALICDVNGDGELTSTDALQLLRVSAKLRTLTW